LAADGIRSPALRHSQLDSAALRPAQARRKLLQSIACSGTTPVTFPTTSFITYDSISLPGISFSLGDLL